MNVRIDDGDVKSGVLSLVIAILEVLHELMSLQAVRRMESHSISPEQSERLGRTLAATESVLQDLKTEYGLQQSVNSLRSGLDRLLDDLVLNEEGGDENATAASVSCC